MTPRPSQHGAVAADDLFSANSTDIASPPRACCLAINPELGYYRFL
jgi:hypothetical protein